MKFKFGANADRTDVAFDHICGTQLCNSCSNMGLDVLQRRKLMDWSRRRLSRYTTIKELRVGQGIVGRMFGLAARFDLASHHVG